MCVCVCVCIYIYMHVFFNPLSWAARENIKFLLLLYILGDDWRIFYDFTFKWTATTGIGIHPTKAWLSLLVNFKNAIWTWGHFKRVTCNKLLLEKMPQKRMERFRLLFDHLALIECKMVEKQSEAFHTFLWHFFQQKFIACHSEASVFVWSISFCLKHQFLSGIRDSGKAGSLWGMMRGVGGVRNSIDQSWLAQGLGLGLLCWGCKGVQEEIWFEEASTFQIGSVAFPAGQCTSPQLHPCHRLFDEDGHQNSLAACL